MNDLPFDPDPRLEMMLSSRGFGLVMDALSTILRQAHWFHAAPKSQVPTEARYVVKPMDNVSLPSHVQTILTRMAERTHKTGASSITRYGKVNATDDASAPTEARDLLAGGVPVYLQKRFQMTLGVCNVPAAHEALLRAGLVLLREYMDRSTEMLDDYDSLVAVHNIWMRLNAPRIGKDAVAQVLVEILDEVKLTHGALLVSDEDGCLVPWAVQRASSLPLDEPVSDVSSFDYQDRFVEGHAPARALPTDDLLGEWFLKALDLPKPAPDELQAFAVPILRDDELLGLVLGCSTEPVVLSDQRMSMLRLLVEGATVILGNALLYEELRQQSESLSSVHVVHRHMRNTRNVPDLACRIAQLACGTFRVPKCVIFLLSTDGKQLLPYAAQGIGKDEVGGQPVGIDEKELPSWVVANHNALRISTPLQDPRFASLTAERYPDTHYLLMPMVDEVVEGVIMLARGDRPFTAAERGTLTILCAEAIIAINNARLIVKEHQQSVSMLRSIANACDLADGRKEGHSENVSLLADRIAARMELDDATREHLHLAALLHNVGYITADVEPAQGRLPGIATDIIRGMQLAPGINEMVRHQSEAWDGSGKPDGLRGEQIPVGARIIVVAKQMVLLREGHQGKAPRGKARALQGIRRKSGVLYDPDVVEALAAIS